MPVFEVTTRFEASNYKMGAAHSDWYDRDVMHEAVARLQAYIAPLGLRLTLTEVGLRWLVFHSGLAERDGSGGAQIEGGLVDVKRRKGKLGEAPWGLVFFIFPIEFNHRPSLIPSDAPDIAAILQTVTFSARTVTRRKSAYSYQRPADRGV